MKSHINEDFLKAYRRLPKEIREQARKAYRLFKDNPAHPTYTLNRSIPASHFIQHASVAVIAPSVSEPMMSSSGSG